MLTVDEYRRKREGRNQRTNYTWRHLTAFGLSFLIQHQECSGWIAKQKVSRTIGFIKPTNGVLIIHFFKYSLSLVTIVRTANFRKWEEILRSQKETVPFPELKFPFNSNCRLGFMFFVYIYIQFNINFIKLFVSHKWKTWHNEDNLKFFSFN